MHLPHRRKLLAWPDQLYVVVQRDEKDHQRSDQENDQGVANADGSLGQQWPHQKDAADPS